MRMAGIVDTPTIAGATAPPSAWGWVLASGGVMLVAGIVALAAPIGTSLVFTIALGWILVIAGVAGMVAGLRARSAHRRSLDLVYGAASLAIGLLALLEPASATAALTLGFALWLAVRGIAELVGATRVRAGRIRVLLVVAGLVNLLLAAALLASWPFPAIEVIGLFVGISLLVAGAVTVATAMQLRRLA
jgi:uncharacterized membrane protein HdeD (DUF308 family)